MAKNPVFERWLKDRPDLVKKIARRFPPGTVLCFHEKPMWVIGYEENGSSSGLLITDVSPFKDYDQAIKNRKPICSCCVAKIEGLMNT